MDCRDWKERISAKVDGELLPEEVRQVDAHLEECAECRALEQKMRAVGIGVARTEGVVPADFREKLFARMEAEELLPRRRSLFVFSLRWAAVPIAAAAALALFLLSPAEKGKHAVSRQAQGPAPTVAQPAPATGPGEPVSPAGSVGPQTAAAPKELSTPAVARTAGEQLTPEEREIIANLDLLEDSSDFDSPGDVDEMELIAPPARSRG